MATSFQKRSRQRKLIYLGLIVTLFTVSLLLRQFLIEPQAFDLRLRARTQGQVELASSAVRLATFGSRGLATAVLWNMALEEQKRHRWNELELLVNSITTLQPNFVSPWLFQSWNLSFNVAVECDRTRDKYFYITRGIQLLARGESKHEGLKLPGGKVSPGNPDMRFYMAIYHLRKIGLSDEQNAMQCLFDMSCIDPAERNPARFQQAEDKVDLKEFRDFCYKHPRLVRRLKRRLRCNSPRKVVAFLERNQGIPSRFQEELAMVGEPTPLIKDRFQQFPMVPPPKGGNDPNPETARDLGLARGEDFDVFVAARLWYTYAQLPLPPLPDEPQYGVNEPEVNLLYYRLPKMAISIFRSWPSRGQEYHAEGLQREGWFFDNGWFITDWFEDLPEHLRTGPVIVGKKDKYDSRQAWQDAYDMYDRFGWKLGILLKEDRLKKLKNQASLYRRTFRQSGSTTIPPERVAQFSKEMKASYDADQMLTNREIITRMCNFDEHYAQCYVESRPGVAEARRLFFRAGELENKGAPVAIGEYKKALEQWLPILLHYKKFRESSSVLLDIGEREHRYLALVEEQFRFSKRQVEDPEMFYMSMATFGNIYPAHAPLVASFAALTYTNGEMEDIYRRRIFPLRNVTGPLDWVFLCELPHRIDKEEDYLGDRLQDYLLGIVQGAQPVPFVASPDQRRLMLTAVTHRNREWIGENNRNQVAKWVPLMPDSILQQVRSDIKYIRAKRIQRANK